MADDRRWVVARAKDAGVVYLSITEAGEFRHPLANVSGGRELF
jgi:hypothetical protein